MLLLGRRDFFSEADRQDLTITPCLCYVKSRLGGRSARSQTPRSTPTIRAIPRLERCEYFAANLKGCPVNELLNKLQFAFEAQVLVLNAPAEFAATLEAFREHAQVDLEIQAGSK
jgi:hypothetical protein